jgi:flagellar operon protein
MQIWNITSAGRTEINTNVFKEEGLKSDATFSELVQQKTNTLRFSSHAMTRMKSRNIDITPDIVDRLTKAVSGAEKKGARDTLILLSDLAFIVNVPNKTVITAMEGRTMKDHVVTNIDSTVIAD